MATDISGKKAERLSLFNQVDLYPVLCSDFTLNRPIMDVLKAVINGGVKIVQLREKHFSKKEFYRLAEKFREHTSRSQVLLIINDHLDIAMGVDADGVHLGQEDLPVNVARKLAPDIIIGGSTHDEREAFDARDQGADYINIGPIFATKTKSLAMNPLGMEMIRNIGSALDIPFTVMGGIKEHHLQDLIRYGASKIAMVTEITQAPNIEKKVVELRKQFSSFGRPSRTL